VKRSEAEKENIMSHFQPGKRLSWDRAAARHGVALLGLTLLAAGPALAQSVQQIEPDTPPATAPAGNAAANAAKSNTAPARSYDSGATAAQNAKARINAELLMAADKGDTVQVRQALEKGGDVEVRGGSYGYTPLMFAASKGHLGTVRLLLKKGAKVNARSTSGVSIPLSSAKPIASETVRTQGQLTQMNYYPILVCESGAISPLMLASAGGYNLTAKELLTKGADVNYRNPDGDTALMYATFTGYLPLVQTLLGRGARVNDVDRYGQSALVQAAWTGHQPVVRLLLEKKARVNTKTRNGWTPVEYAKAGNHTALAKLLEQVRVREAKWEAAHPSKKPVTNPQPRVKPGLVPDRRSIDDGSIIIVR